MSDQRRFPEPWRIFFHDVGGWHIYDATDLHLFDCTYDADLAERTANAVNALAGTALDAALAGRLAGLNLGAVVAALEFVQALHARCEFLPFDTACEPNEPAMCMACRVGRALTPAAPPAAGKEATA